MNDMTSFKVDFSFHFHFLSKVCFWDYDYFLLVIGRLNYGLRFLLFFFLWKKANEHCVVVILHIVIVILSGYLNFSCSTRTKMKCEKKRNRIDSCLFKRLMNNNDERWSYIYRLHPFSDYFWGLIIIIIIIKSIAMNLNRNLFYQILYRFFSFF